MDIRSEKILRLHTSDDGYTVEQLLVYLLGRVCTGDHGCEYRVSNVVGNDIFLKILKKKKGQIFLSLSVHLRIPMRSIQTSEIRKQLRISDVGGGDRRLSQFVIHDLDPCLRHILRGRHTRVHKRGEILFLVNLVI